MIYSESLQLAIVLTIGILLLVAEYFSREGFFGAPGLAITVGALLLILFR